MLVRTFSAAVFGNEAVPVTTEEIFIFDAE
jgi:hypothetical protein